MTRSFTALSDAMLDELVDAARRAHPAEACVVGFGARGTVARLVPLANRAADPRREFRADDVACASALVRARRCGMELQLIAHSHPSGDGRPSERDHRFAAAWPDVVHAVVTPEACPPVRYHAVVDGRLEEVSHAER